MNEPHAVIQTSSDWPVRTVGQLTTFLRRGTAPRYVEASDVFAIGQRCVTDGGFDGLRARPHSNRAMKGVVAPEVNDVLLNSTGTGTIGRSVIFRDESASFIVDGHVTVVRPKQEELVSRWLNDTLRSPDGQRYLETRCYAGSTNQIELSASALASMPLAVPDVAEQRRVADVLDTIDEHIALIEAVIAKLGAVRRGQIVDLLAADDVESSVRLGDLADVASGVTLGSEPSGPGTVARPYLRVANVQDGYLDLAEIKFVRVRVSDLARFMLAPGDVLMNEGGDADKLGRGAVWRGEIPDCLHQNHVFRVRCNASRLDPDYLSIVTGSPVGKRYFMAASKQTTNLASINSTQIKAFPVPLRSIETQLRIVEAVRATVQLASAEQAAVAKLKLLRSALAEALLSGRVRVGVGATA